MTNEEKLVFEYDFCWDLRDRIEQRADREYKHIFEVMTIKEALFLFERGYEYNTSDELLKELGITL